MYDLTEKELDSLQRMRYTQDGRSVLYALERSILGRLRQIVLSGNYDKEAQAITGELRLLEFLQGDKE